MDPGGTNSEKWTNEKHSHFLSSMEASFVRTMLHTSSCASATHHRHRNCLPERLDRYVPDISESTLDLDSVKAFKSGPGSGASDFWTSTDRQRRRRNSTDSYKASVDQRSHS